jgi:hypothetical protein
MSAPTAAVLDALERRWADLDCLVCTHHQATPCRLYTFCPRCDSYPERTLTIESNGTGATLFCKDGCSQSDILEALGGVSPSSARAQVHKSRDELFEACHELASESRILDRLRSLLPQIGLVGEDENALLIYLAATSRLLDSPVSAALKGPSSSGKSWTVERVLQFFPDRAYHALSAMSERALVYSEEPLEHRMMVIFEAAGMTGEFASYLMRSLLSEGRVRYETVESTSDGLKPKLIERNGPTGLIVTTTQVRLHPENETRVLSLTAPDTPDQTRDVMLSLAEENDVPDVDLAPWLALQEWLAEGDNAVSIPFGKELAKAIPPKAVRLRRDFRALLGLIRTHALLHQATRERDDKGQIVATTEDYAVVRGLVEEVFSAGLGATVKSETQETVQAVAALAPDHEDGVPHAMIARALVLDRSTAARRVAVAIDGGYLRNLEERARQRARIVTGDPLPEEEPILPPPEDLCTSAHATEGGTPPHLGLERTDGCTACGGRLAFTDEDGVRKCAKCGSPA